MSPPIDLHPGLQGKYSERADIEPASDSVEIEEADSAPRRSPPCTMVIFGGGGDLTRRLLVPAIYNLVGSQLLDEGFSIIAVDWSDLDTATLRNQLGETMRQFVAQRRSSASELHEADWEWLSQRISFLRGGFDESQTYQTLSSLCGVGNCVFYLAVAARFFAPIVGQLEAAGLTRETESRFRRVVVEKPFGSDLISARALNAQLRNALDESQIYRIDHYLGKETVQNILALRFSNGFFEPLWNRQNIDHVQITAAETVGVEKRGRFYETTGALRDMVPNHIMQLLAMVAMEAPISFDADAVRDEKSKVLAAVHQITAKDIVRGQYTAGSIAGRALAGYRDEPDVAPDSQAESFIAMKLSIDNWRWAGVPFYVRTGKRLALRKTEIAIHFKQAPYALFRETPVEKLTPNIMVLQIQPTEGVTMQFSAKMPGPTVKLGGVRMKFDYADWFQEGPSTGYETLIYDCLIGDATLFQRADNVEAGWKVVQPAIEAWKDGGRNAQSKLQFYAAGKAGPDAADALLARDGRHWLRLNG
ncbi:MAG: glucose-6-phosphate dehydrogenase [Janthinobacterium lividum]